MRCLPCFAALTALALGATLITGCSAATTSGTPSVPAHAPVTPGSVPSASASTSVSASPGVTVSPSPTVTATTASPPATASAPPRDSRRASQRNTAFTVEGIPVISKKHPINGGYRRSSVTAPYGLTKPTQAALTRLTAAAARDGVRVLVRSGYRSYGMQKQILRRKIAEYGSEKLARRYNAAPGRSEHQAGLAVDLWDGRAWGLGVRTTKVGRWLWKNAWRYGFILRYPNGKEKITGYAFEPWHYRYVGRAAAKGFGPNSDLTLEEYLGLA